MRQTGLEEGRRLRTRDLRAVTVAWGLILIASACDRGDSRVVDVPLGWDGATEADAVRKWSRKSVESVPRWKVEESPLVERVPHAVEAALTGTEQRYPSDATFLPDGRIVLYYYVSDYSEPDSILLRILDPESGEETRIPAPKGDNGRSLEWVHFDLATRDGCIVLMGDNQPALSRRQGEDIWWADGDGRFIGSPSSTHIEGTLLGVFRDQSLAVMGYSVMMDTMFLSPATVVYPVKAGHDPADARAEEVLVTTAMPRDRAGASRSAPSWIPRPAFTSGMSGDTIWLMPTERPELYAVDRSGNVVLKVEWDAGDRSIPPGAPEFWEGADRFPAAVSLMVGADGLIYIEKVAVLEGRPVRDAEWLVFSPAGELMARLDVGGRFPSFDVLAFGDGALVATVWDEDTSLTHVNVYRFRKSGHGSR